MSPLAETIKNHIEKNRRLTFAELSGLLGSHAEGGYSYQIAPNLIVWAGMSREFVDAMQELKPIVDLEPANALSYLFDGRALCLPIAARPRPKGYTKPHWMPVSLIIRSATRMKEYRAAQ